ncbi:MAG: hypothetical protein KGJ57_18505 [Sphingomonadales bacterium]|nr:hypothetical protein [Sphingomonadales bacterium]MDE2171392.1 hypothetical protein [Sphingomonadales bacterium]
MSILPPEFHARDADKLSEADARLATRWAALAGAAQVVAGLAGARQVEAALHIPFALDRAVGGRRVLIEEGIDDMLAMMEPGITALLDVAQRGGQTEPAAMALWQEFLRARAGLVALAPIAPVAR